MEQKKLKKIIVGTVLFIAIGVITGFAVNYANHQPLKGVVVNLNDEDFHNFLQKNDIEAVLLQDRNLSINTLNRSNIDLHAMERIIRANPWVKDAEVFISNNDLLQINVKQRIPVARIFTQQGASYYIDEQLQIMPPAVGYSYPAVVFTNVRDIKNQQEIPAQQAAIAKLASFILSDTFWRHQVTQVNMMNDYEFELSTLVGNQKIIFGDTSKIHDKFDNLFVFYKQVSNKLGWDKYTELDVRFGNQVVARPSLGWVAPKPKDTAVALPDEIKNINEIIASFPEKSVIEEEKIELPKPDGISQKDAIKVKKNTEQPTIKDTENQVKKDNIVDANRKAEKETNTLKADTTSKKKESEQQQTKQQPKYKYPG